MIFRKVFIKVFELIHSIIFNFTYLPFNDAKKLPVYVHYGFPIIELHRGNLHLSSKDIKRFSIRLGAHGTLDYQCFMG